MSTVTATGEGYSEPRETLEDIGVYIPAGVSPSDVQGGTITFIADSGN